MNLHTLLQLGSRSKFVERIKRYVPPIVSLHFILFFYSSFFLFHTYNQNLIFSGVRDAKTTESKFTLKFLALLATESLRRLPIFGLSVRYRANISGVEDQRYRLWYIVEQWQSIRWIFDLTLTTCQKWTRSERVIATLTHINIERDKCCKSYCYSTWCTAARYILEGYRIMRTLRYRHIFYRTRTHMGEQNYVRSSHRKWSIKLLLITGTN